MADPTGQVVGASPGDPAAAQGPYTEAGYWMLTVDNPVSGKLDVTWFRSIPTVLDSWSFADPYGPKDAKFVFPKITYFDRLGAGDLSWCTKDTNITLYFVPTVALPANYPFQYQGVGFYSWEGYMESFSFNAEGLTVTCKGAMYQLDNWLAKPEYLSRPLPYEYAIARQFYKGDKPSLRTGLCQVNLPSWASAWTPPARNTPAYLIPVSLKKGSKWTGLVTRSTGSWDHVLSDYIQSLLSSMYTAYGRYTLDLLPGRQPAFFHRDFGNNVQAGRTIIVDPAIGIDIGGIEQDFSQTFTTAFGQVKSATGLEYSGQEVYADPMYGTRTVYEPLAELRQAHVRRGRKDDWADPTVMVREQLLQMQAGIDADTAMDVARDHLGRHADPGITGQITIKSDPTFVTGVSYATGYPVVTSSTTLPRQLVRPGMTMLVPGLLGSPEGVLLHIAETECNKDGTVKVTVDSKNRDRLTVAEVRQHGRDSLSVPRSIIGGSYNPVVSDSLVPWNYGAGSGFIPSAPNKSCVSLFKGMPAGIAFPWTDWTTLRPPSNKAWKNCYIRIGPKNANANKNWGYLPHGAEKIVGDGTQQMYGIPIKLSQAATIRLIEIAAYDVNGNVMQVPFHVGIYNQYGVNVQSMPMITSLGVAGRDGYGSGQHYPFFSQAWERFTTKGSTITTEQQLAVSSAGLVRAWGTRYAPAGYWPGSKAAGDKPSGLLVDEGQWNWTSITDEAGANGTVDLRAGQSQPKFAGYGFLLIYCDAQLTQDVYFLGRMYRTEPGADG